MLETHSTKATAVGESNNAGVWGSEPPDANGGSWAEPPTLRRFYSYFFKITHFSHIWCICLLKTAFL